MYLPRTGGYPPRAHIPDPWSRAILHAPNTFCTPTSTPGSLGMGVEWGSPHWLLVVSDLDQSLEFSKSIYLLWRKNHLIKIHIHGSIVIVIAQPLLIHDTDCSCRPRRKRLQWTATFLLRSGTALTEGVGKGQIMWLWNPGHHLKDQIEEQ